MEFSKEFDKIFKSLQLFQCNYTSPKKDSNGQVGGRTYGYVSLDALLDHIRPQLCEVGCFVMQHIEQDVLTTLVCHNEGQWIKSSMRLRDNDPRKSKDGRHLTSSVQDMGGGLTYLKRYAICAILAISIDTDNDGKEEDPASQPRKKASERSERSGSSTYKKPTPPPAKNFPVNNAQESRIKKAGKQLQEVDKETALRLSKEIEVHKFNQTWHKRIASAYIDKLEDAYNKAIEKFT